MIDCGIARLARGGLAAAALIGRHQATVTVGGYRWRYCAHRSHRHRLRCWRWAAWDGYCTRHNTTCWDICEENR